MPVPARASGRASVLNCGLVRERGTDRTSTSRSIPACRSSPTSSATDRVEWPMVKIEFVRSIALLMGRQIVIDFLSALESSAGAETTDVAFERRALFECTELQTEADMRADIDVGRSETVAHEVIALRYLGLARVPHLDIGAVP